jgi:hypothetical protein
MRTTLSALLTILALASTAQGLIFDNVSFDKREELEVTRATLPTRYSLKEYTPDLLYPQVLSDCVAHAFGMARTVSIAKNLKITDRTKISLLLTSPWHMYYRLSTSADQNCSVGLNIEKAAEFALNDGFAMLSNVEYPNYYPFSSSTLCKSVSRSFYPPSINDDSNNARKLAFDKVYAIRTIDQLKQALAQGMPVVVGLMIPKSFESCRSSTFTLSSYDKINLTYGHAMLVIGYNDLLNGGSLEILNSWGDQWGASGYTNIRYVDFLAMVGAAYACYDAPNYGSERDFYVETDDSVKEETIQNVSRVFQSLDERSNMFNNSEIIRVFDSTKK